jgi:hypothetical protein
MLGHMFVVQVAAGQRIDGTIDDKPDVHTKTS